MLFSYSGVQKDLIVVFHVKLIIAYASEIAQTPAYTHARTHNFAYVAGVFIKYRPDKRGNTVKFE